jgi:dihydrofolate reductase
MVTLIAAMGRNRIIGIDGRLPWHLPKDLAHFKTATLHHPIIMGRLTYESLGRPLPKRLNIVLSRSRGAETRVDEQGVTWCPSMDALAHLDCKEQDWMVIGGAQIYSQMMPYAQRMLLTMVDVEMDGDAFFPTYDPTLWRTISQEKHLQDSEHPYAFTIVTLERREPPLLIGDLS